MNPLLPNHAMPFFGPEAGLNWGGVPWNKAALVSPRGLNLIQMPWRNQFALWEDASVLILSGSVDDDCDGPGGSTQIDPCYQPDTSLRWPDGGSIDLRQFRGMVMHAAVEDHGGELGDFGLSCWDGVIHAVQYADLGPTRKLQEGSEKILRDTGVIAPGQSSRHAAVVGNDVQDFCSLIFLGSAPKDAHGRPYAVPQNEIISRTIALWERFTGRTPKP